MKKLTPRLWSALVLIGLMGQFAWTIENMYFNVFLYNTITTDPGYIAAMVATSAVAATVTTLLMGVVSDRAGRRKPFICGGYMLWGLSTGAFGFITVENAGALFPAANAVAVAAVMVIAMDCVMTFFGSTANDAAFNAYVTDQIDNSRRGKVESVLTILPLISMLVIFGFFDGMTQAGNWRTFFLIFGALVTLVGVAAIFLLPEEPFAPKREPFASQIAYGFRPSVIGANRALYLALLSLCVFSIAMQVFFPYLIIYLQHYLQMDSYALVLGAVLMIASAVSVLGGRVIDRIGRLRFCLPAGLFMLAGLVGMYFARGMAWVILAGAVMMSGYMLLTTAISAEVRALTPARKAGHFQGIRMIFGVMLPMIVGPFIGAAVIRGNAETYMELGELKTVPTPMIFLAAAAAMCLLIVPLMMLRREKRTKEEAKC